MAESKGPQRTRPIKIILLGDGTVGKTALLMTYTNQDFPTTYIPTLAPQKIVPEGADNKLLILDTPGQAEWKKLRMLQYKGADLFIILFALDNQNSMDNISEWIPELRTHDPNVPFMVVGTKADVRAEGKAIITEAAAREMASGHGATVYAEVSAMHNQGVAECFAQAVQLIQGDEKKDNCVIL